ncbi:MAG: hypothetical protein PUC65_09440 [Clostridiales bacterium]|nr:hypothetical protein [Clostridiales bacterium]
MNHNQELNARNLYNFAVDLLIGSNNKKLVKLGLTILEMFQANDALKEAVRLIGLSDEFTIFAVFLMRAWENASTEILNLAKKVEGWGRIHAIAEIISSLLVEGHVSGISVIANSNAMINKFLAHSPKQKMIESDKQIVNDVTEWARENTED